MKAVFVHTVFIFTCFYFFTGGNVNFFSKMGKGVPTEIFDINEDAPDSEGKEGKDCKEDGCDEEIYLEILKAALMAQRAQMKTSFRELSLFVPGYSLDKNSPPPRA